MYPRTMFSFLSLFPLYLFLFPCCIYAYVNFLFNSLLGFLCSSLFLVSFHFLLVNSVNLSTCHLLVSLNLSLAPSFSICLCLSISLSVYLFLFFFLSSLSLSLSFSLSLSLSLSRSLSRTHPVARTHSRHP